MKYTIKDEQKEFKPLQIILTIESREELIELYKRLNVNGFTIDKHNSLFENYKSSGKFTDLWKELRNLSFE